MCLVVFGCSLIDYFTEFKIISRWIVEPLGFAYGILAAKYANEIKKWIGKKWHIKSIVLMVISALIGIAYLKFKPYVFWGDYALKILLGIVITTFIFTIIGKVKVGNKINGFLGSISYEVYLTHLIAFSLVSRMLSGIESGIYISVSIIVTMMLSVSVHWLKKLIMKRG